uniref:Rod shape-determining protein MreD n=1 Tax=Candidatus Aschnera chinzeii TaxID=1485666 RepID=A0AAT9G3U8_9ENTR|nr:MAG: hypothetical protein ACHINZ_0710 [Candidatus Aschnera chinzeii]
MIYKTHKHEWKIIITSFLLAYILEQMPLPKQFIYYRPTWLLLILIYWIINTPNNINIGISFIIGIITDLTKYSIIGVHALLYTIICYIILIMHNIYSIQEIWKQICLIGLLSIIVNYIFYILNFFFIFILFIMKYFLIQLVIH